MPDPGASRISVTRDFSTTPYLFYIENAGLSDFLAVILTKNDPWTKS